MTIKPRPGDILSREPDPRLVEAERRQRLIRNIGFGLAGLAGVVLLGLLLVRLLSPAAPSRDPKKAAAAFEQLMTAGDYAAWGAELRQDFPALYAQTRQIYVDRIVSGDSLAAAEAAMLTPAGAYRQSHIAALNQAPDAALGVVSQTDLAIITKLQPGDLKVCAGYVMTGQADSREPAVRQGLGRAYAAVFRALHEAQVAPVQRPAASLADEDQFAKALDAGGMRDEIVQAVLDGELKRYAIADQCAAGLDTARALATLPVSVQSKLIAKLLANAAP